MVSKKAQELPVNMVVMIILGLIIFGLGIGLFSKISNSGNEEVDRLNEQVKLGITSLEFQGDDWVCAPAYDINNGDGATFYLYIANKDDENHVFKVEFVGAESGSGDIESAGCGHITLNYLSTLEFNVISGESAEIPYIIKAKNVKKTPCSFIVTAKLLDTEDSDFEQKTAVIIKVK